MLLQYLQKEQKLFHLGAEGSKIAKGDLLLEADLKEIEEAQLSPVTLVVITNSDSFKHIYIETPEKVTSGEQVIIAE